MRADRARAVVWLLASALCASLSSWLPAQLTWLLRDPAVRPPGRLDCALASRSATGDVVLFGGLSRTGGLGDTWTFDGVDWTPCDSEPAPRARRSHALAYDSVRDRVVLFGGENAALFGDTWEWDGESWEERTPAVSPPARWRHLMTYDPARQRVVMTSGEPNANDTWEWDGVAWEQRLASGSPPAFSFAGMAFDPARGQAILFTGATPGTFAWDGSGWTQLTPSTSPPARRSIAMTTDPVARTVIAYLGSGEGGAREETWQWNGTDWRRRTPVESPSAYYHPALAYCGRVQRVLLFGYSYTDLTWTLEPTPSPRYESFGSSCGPEPTRLALAAVDGIGPLAGTRFVAEVSGLAPDDRLVFMLLGLSRDSWFGQFALPFDLAGLGSPGCQLLTRADVVYSLGPVGDRARWWLDVPLVNAALGFTWYNQAIVLRTASSGLRVSVTHAATAVVGHDG